jgi:hypothetical protein
VVPASSSNDEGAESDAIPVSKNRRKRAIQSDDDDAQAGPKGSRKKIRAPSPASESSSESEEEIKEDFYFVDEKDKRPSTKNAECTRQGLSVV